MKYSKKAAFSQRQLSQIKEIYVNENVFLHSYKDSGRLTVYSCQFK